MLRIIPVTGTNGHKVMRIEGEIREAWVPLLRDECDMTLVGEPARALELDLKHVTYVDAAGRMLLRSLKTRGVRLSNCTPLIEALLEDSAP